MIRTDFRLAAVAALALGLSGTAALARPAPRVVAPAQADAVVVPAEADAFAAPAVEVVRPAAVVETSFVPPNVMGQFTCTFNERHTRLERQACGSNSYRYPRVAD